MLAKDLQAWAQTPTSMHPIPRDEKDPIPSKVRDAMAPPILDGAQPPPVVPQVVSMGPPRVHA